MTKKRLIFFDIDDTLIDTKNHRIPLDAAKAVWKLYEKGYTLCIATGRDFQMIPSEVKELCPWAYLICCNGQVIMNGNYEVIEKILFPKEVVLRCIVLARKNGIQIEFKTPGSRFLLGEPDEWMEKAFRYFQIPYPPVEKYEGQEILAGLMFPPEGKRIPDFDAYEKIQTFYGGNHYCDITLAGVTKASGIRKVLERSGFREYTAVGDSENDMEMLAGASPAIAMGNAPESVRKRADYIVGTAGEGGIAQAAAYILQLDEGKE